MAVSSRKSSDTRAAIDALGRLLAGVKSRLALFARVGVELSIIGA